MMKSQAMVLSLVLMFAAIVSSRAMAYSGGAGTAASPYQISSAADWQELMTRSGDWGKQFIVTADIDLAGVVVTPVGTNSTTFGGILDGGGYTIRNVYIDLLDSDYVGLFGRIGAAGQVGNLKLIEVQVHGKRYTGGLCGANFGQITDCSVTGRVSGGDWYAGGLCGLNNGGTISQSYAAVQVSGSSLYVGGLCGGNYQGTITSCYSSGYVFGGGNHVGGLCGYNFSSGQIHDSYATGIVTGEGNNVGGLCGGNSSGTIRRCHASGIVKGVSSVGGLVGYNFSSGSIYQCYALGAVSGSGNSIGGLCGYAAAGAIGQCYAAGLVTGSSFAGGLCGFNSGTVSDCFWDMETTGKSASAGGSGVAGKTTAQMKILSTFTDAGWDFTDTDGDPADWRMPQGDYPRLAWETFTNANASPWKLVSNMTTARDQFTGCVMDGKIYVFGGNGNPDGLNLNSGEVYDIAADSWSSIASNTSDGIEELSGVGLNGKFYVFGGCGYDDSNGYSGVINFNQMYNPDTNTWTTLAQKPTTTSSATPVVYDGKIYLFGGYYSDENPSSQRIDYAIVEAYDPATNSWEYITEIPELLFNPAIAVYGDSAYLIGGYNPSTDTISTEVMVYHFSSNTWTRDYCTTGDTGRGYSYAGPVPVVNGKAYIVGGGEGTSMADHWVSDSAIVFDISKKTWSSLPKLPEPRASHLAVMHDRTIYVIGGYADENDPDGAESTVYALTLNIADLDGDGDVDYNDLLILTNQWLQSPGNPSADIAPSPAGDGIVNFGDFALFASHWLEDGML